MKLRHVYLALALLGTAAPYAAFVPWLLEHGLDVPLLVTELFSTRAGAFFGLDVIVSAVVLFVLVAAEQRRVPVRFPWLPVLATLAVGVSAGLPLYLYLRELARDGGSGATGSPGK